jgi:hypothetical protein
MKIVLSGLPQGFDPEALHERMSKFGPVIDVKPVTDGHPDRPMAIVDLALGAEEATAVARRIDGIYYQDRFLQAWVMLHG